MLINNIEVKIKKPGTKYLFSIEKSWNSLKLYQWLFLFGLAAVGTLGHFFLILSLNLAEASKLAPFSYFEIVSNVIIGYYFFGDFPDIWIWIGLFLKN